MKHMLLYLDGGDMPRKLDAAHLYVRMAKNVLTVEGGDHTSAILRSGANFTRVGI